jgi:hypothetical protein
MTYEYKKTVAAAVAETQSKFALAEALAIEIPPQRRGPKPKNSNAPQPSVWECLMDVKLEIRRAGGEPKSETTLQQYRDTALWVSMNVQGNFKWIKGVSFSAHQVACAEGLSYDEFAAMDKKTAAAVRNRTENAVDVVQKSAEIARNLLSDPDVVKQVINDPATRTTVRKALDEAYAGAPKPYADHTDKQPHDHEVEVLVRLRAISAAIRAATDVIHSGPSLGATTDDLAAIVDRQIEELRVLREVLAGRSDMDAELAKILENGA